MSNTLVLVVPVFNEAASAAQTLPRILAAARDAAGQGGQPLDVRLLTVDDGSTDATREVLAAMEAQDDAMRSIAFTRNFGKEAAIHAGLRHACEKLDARAVIVIDADLQHPPELMGEMLAHWRAGAAVVEAVKRERGDESAARRLAARLFYGTFTRLSGMRLDQDTDYKLLDRRVADAVVRMDERARFFRGIVRWLGYPSRRIAFDVAPRAAGGTRWARWALARYAWRNLTAFSSAPLGMVTGLGAVGLAVGLVLAAKALLDKLQGQALTGFSTVILLQVIFGSLILLALGIIGNYVARIYDELKQRPHYILRPGDGE